MIDFPFNLVYLKSSTRGVKCSIIQFNTIEQENNHDKSQLIVAINLSINHKNDLAHNQTLISHKHLIEHMVSNI